VAKPIDLLQGTLDMLILKPYRWGLCTGTACCCASSKFPKTGWKFSKARCIRRCIAWNIRAGSRANGRIGKISARRNITG